VVTDWNLITIQVINASSPPAGASPFLHAAAVHLAVHDAIAAIDGQFRPYHVVIPGASGSPIAAAVKAAHDVLVNRFPAQSAVLDMTYNNYLTAHGLSSSDPGVAVGQKAAAGIIAFRANDGSFPSVPPPPFTGGTGIGVWRPTPPAFAPMATPWLADVRPYGLNSSSQFLANAPPDVTSGLYARDYEEVKSLGSLNSTTRTAEQTDLAYFWSGNYLVIWNQALRDIAVAQKLDLASSARLFALTSMAMADAGITAWNTKRHYVFWRPITAIQNGDIDGNPKTIGDPSWQPLIVSPPYPEYTSGANNVTGAVTRMLRRFFGTDKVTFSVTTTVALAIKQTRVYQRFSDAADDVVQARVWEGIHFANSDTEARRQGETVSTWIFTRFLRPVHDNGDDEGGDDQ
jgi:hypothetical protein